MKRVDELMATCPLKHEIRVDFWEPYIRKLKRKPVSYLTLYSPPLMDVKYFHNCGLIEENDGVYQNVVGVGFNTDAEADTTARLDKRLELLLSGNINTLITGDKSKPEKVKQLESKFPFDVINLDYTDTLHNYSREEELSPHISAIETILERQSKRNKEDFILFVTTDANMPAYLPKFIEDLRALIDKNIAETPQFSERLKRATNCNNSTEYFNRFQKDCFAVSLVKFILGLLSDYSYTIVKGDIKWLIRDQRDEEKRMLHLGFHIKRFMPPKINSRSAIGNRRNNVEAKSVGFIAKDYYAITEKNDLDRLKRLHAEQLNDFNRRTFELDVPEPKDE